MPNNHTPRPLSAPCFDALKKFVDQEVTIPEIAAASGNSEQDTMRALATLSADQERELISMTIERHHHVEYKAHGF